MEEKLLQIKNQIISELGLLTYLENKKVHDNLDEEFIKKELESISKTKRTLKLFSIFWLFLSLSFLVLFFLNVSFDDVKGIYYLQILIGTGYLIISILTIIQIVSLNKKESLYKILAVFSKNQPLESR